MTDSERQQILKMIEDGKITADEGLRLMQALGEELPDDAIEVVVEPPFQGEHSDDSTKKEFEARVNKLRRLWIIPVSIGVAFAIPGAWWMYQNVEAGLNGWFIFAFLFFLFGVFLIALGAGSRTSRWIYVNVKEKPGSSPQHIVFAFPIPFGLIRWGINNFGHHIPDRERAITDDVMKAVFESDALDEPMLVDVKEEDGQHVRVYIG
jgi:hypothetical protein